MTGDDRQSRIHRLFAGELEDHRRILEQGLLALERVTPTEREDLIGQLVRAAHTLKGSAGMVGAPGVAAICHDLEEDLGELRDASGPPPPEIVADLLARVDGLRTAWDPPRQPARAPAKSPGSRDPDASVRLPSTSVEALVTSASDVQSVALRLADVPATVRGLREQLEHGQVESATAAVAELERTVEAELRGLTRAVDEVDRVARYAATVPLTEVCEGLSRAVRDIAAGSGKQAALRLEVGDVGVDRQSVATLRECLLHLVRNAVDHGLELPERRLESGKPEEGTVTVTASGVGERVVVSVHDDGRGIDTASVRSAAERAGLDDTDDPAEMVFAPGLSTAPRVTEISGRGVGLDVVRERTEALGGTVELTSTSSRGTTITVTVPASLSTARVVVAEVDDDRIALLSSGVRHLVRARPEDVVIAEGRPLLQTDRGLLRLGSLGAVLELQSGPASIPDDGRPAVIVGSDVEEVAILVDRIHSEQDAIVVPLHDLLADLPAVLGAAVLPGGHTALVCHPVALVRESRELEIALADVEAPPAPPRILLVDDAPTTRALEQGILETAGYEVVLAGDGQEAWERLQSDEVDLVVSDVTMPRMDGFELCEAIRGSSRFRHLPIVLVTSLGSEQDRQRGADAGADAYLVKGGFDQTNLLRTIGNLL